MRLFSFSLGYFYQKEKNCDDVSYNLNNLRIRAIKTIQVNLNVDYLISLLYKYSVSTMIIT